MTDPGTPAPGSPTQDGRATAGPAYASRLSRLSGPSWKRFLRVQAPYEWHLRRLGLGRTLDVGCGIGRNLAHLPEGSVGVDHNETAVRTARSAGLTAQTPSEFWSSPNRGHGEFDSILIAHVLEHLGQGEADALIAEYLPALRAGGLLVMITPQERGFRTDATHVRFVDEQGLARHAVAAGLRPVRSYSFPFPRRVGRVFPYNEFVLRAVRD